MTARVPSVTNDYDSTFIFWNVGWEGKCGRHKSVMKEKYLGIFHKCPLLQINDKERSYGTSRNLLWIWSHRPYVLSVLEGGRHRVKERNRLSWGLNYFQASNFRSEEDFHHHILKTMIIITIITDNYVLWTLRGILHALSHFILIIMLWDI